MTKFFGYTKGKPVLPPIGPGIWTVSAGPSLAYHFTVMSLLSTADSYKR